MLFKLCFYVPEEQLEQVKKAVFESGAGRVGNYAQCCWQTLGVGQFLPLPGSDPFIGNEAGLEKVDEYKVELVCAEECLAEAVAALRRTHPYEEPSYHVWRLEDL